MANRSKALDENSKIAEIGRIHKTIIEMILSRLDLIRMKQYHIKKIESITSYVTIFRARGEMHGSSPNIFKILIEGSTSFKQKKNLFQLNFKLTSVNLYLKEAVFPTDMQIMHRESMTMSTQLRPTASFEFMQRYLGRRFKEKDVVFSFAKTFKTYFLEFVIKQFVGKGGTTRPK